MKTSTTSKLSEEKRELLVSEKPTPLMMYKMDADQAIPVLLDIDSMQDDVVLLLDTFFYITIWKG